MSGNTTMKLSDTSATSSLELYNAFKALTTNRAQNRGTIEVVTNGGSVTNNGRVTKLKCAQHHFYSGSVVKPNKDLCDWLSFAVDCQLLALEQKLKLGMDSTSDGTNADKLERFEKVMGEVRKNVLSKIHDQADSKSRTPRPLTREDIKGIISQVEVLKSLSVDNLLEIGADALTNPKALQNISIAAGLKTEFKPGELGSKAPKIKDPIVEGFYADHRAILARVKKACKGKTCSQAFVHALNQFALRAPAFEYDYQDHRKDMYKEIARKLKQDIAFFSPKKGESPAIALRDALLNSLKPYRPEDGDYGDHLSKLERELENIIEEVTTLYFYKDPATKKVLEREVL